MHEATIHSDNPVTAASPTRRVILAGVAFDALTLDQTADAVVSAVHSGRGGWVITANLDHLRRARSDPDYRAMLEEADLVVADGMPLIWASRLSGQRLPERVAGSSLVQPLARRAAERGLGLFLLGGNPGVADRAAQLLADRYPGLEIVGTACPPLGFERDEAYMRGLRDQMVNAGADLVYVALGSPKQERLIREIKDWAPSAYWLGVGISLSFLTGDVRRAPRWLQRLGLEWLHRLVQEPRRLAKRYLVDGLPFAVVFLWGSIRARARYGRSTRTGP